MASKQDIITAVRHFDKFLKIPALKGAVARMNKGKPFFITGGYTMVFEVTNGSQKWAFRIWHIQMKDLKERFRKISAHLQTSNLPYFTDFIFDENGILVNGELHDTIRMKWVDGVPLKEYLKVHLDNKQLLIKFARDFLEMCHDLRTHYISHGDLQHGNILVENNGSIKLVDYDSICVPGLEGLDGLVAGLKGYQHPSRFINNDASLKADYFSELIIYLSILALAEKNSLWDDCLVEQSEHLLFSEEDFADLEKSKIFGSLQGLTQDIDGLLHILKLYLKESSFQNLRPFESYQIPPQIIYFRIDRDNIVRGMPVLLEWETVDATSAEIDNGIGLVACQGSIAVMRDSSAMFTLSAKGFFGTSRRSVKLLVFEVPEIKSVKVPIPEISAQISFATVNLRPPDINFSFSMPATSALNVSLHPSFSLSDRLISALKERETVFSLLHVYDQVKKSLH